MNQTASRANGTRAEMGFSLVELLVVIGIIAVLAAVTGPPIVNYLRNYQIRAGTQTLAGDIQAARTRAITKNVNLGVVVVVEDATTYWTHLEDDQPVGGVAKSTARQRLDSADPEAEQSTRRQLPAGIEFALTAADCPSVAGFAPADAGFRFNRLGAWCDPGAGGACPALPVDSATVNAVFTTAAGSTLCLLDRRSSLSRNVTVMPGGRVRFQQ